jgi:hypothetical protein
MICQGQFTCTRALALLNWPFPPLFCCAVEQEPRHAPIMHRPDDDGICFYLPQKYMQMVPKCEKAPKIRKEAKKA